MLKYFVRNRNFKSSSVSLSSEDAFEYEFPVNFRLDVDWESETQVTEVSQHKASFQKK